MTALGEQQPHLLAGDLVPHLEGVDTLEAAADPATRRLTWTLVVTGQIRPAPMGRIQRRHLPNQIVIAMTGRQLMKAHCHTHIWRSAVGRRSRTPHSVQWVCGTSNLENRRGYVRQPQSSGDRSSHRSGLGRSEADVIGSGADGSAVGKAGSAQDGAGRAGGAASGAGSA